MPVYTTNPQQVTFSQLIAKYMAAVGIDFKITPISTGQIAQDYYLSPVTVATLGVEPTSTLWRYFTRAMFAGHGRTPEDHRDVLPGSEVERPDGGMAEDVEARHRRGGLSPRVHATPVYYASRHVGASNVSKKRTGSFFIQELYPRSNAGVRKGIRASGEHRGRRDQARSEVRSSTRSCCVPSL